MRRLPLILISLLAVLPLLVSAGPLYKWVDDQGNVHYSDKPHPGAQKIVLPKATTYKAPDVAMPTPPANDSDSQQNSPQTYTQITVSSPADQATVWNTDTVTVAVSLTPALQPGDTVTFSVDGNSQTVAASSATFNELDRGEHAVTVTVNGKYGRITAQSVFYIQRGTKGKPPL